MKYKIVIPKKGEHIGEARVEGMEQNSSCATLLQEIAVGFGPIISNEKKDHFGDDNPVYDSVTIN